MLPESLDNDKFNPRRIVREFLEISNPYRNFGSEIPDVQEFALKLEQFKREVVRDILFDELEAEHYYERLLSAYLLLESYRLGEHSEKALNVFRTAFNSSDPKKVEMALLSALGWSKVPAELSIELKNLLRHDVPRIRSQAAMIGVRILELRAECAPFLTAGINSEDAVTQFESSIAAIKARVDPARAWNAIIKLSEGKQKKDYFELVFGMLNSLEPGPEAAPYLLRLISDQELKYRTRALIARLIGIAEPESSVIQQELVRLVQSENWRLVFAAAESLSHQNLTFPESATNALVGHLSSMNSKLRETAAICLHRFYPRLEETHIRKVVGRMEVERDIEIFTKLMEICMISGDVALPPLVESIGKVTQLRQLLCFATLTQMGAGSCTEVIRQFAKADNRESKRLLAGLIASSKLENSDLIPQLRSMILGEDLEDSKNAMLALANAGESIAHLTPDLLQLVIGEDAERARLAEQVIEGIGPMALTYFGQMEAQVNDDRIEKLRARIESQGRSRGSHELSWFDDINELRVFVLLAEEIERSGGASYAQIEKSLESKQRAELISDDLGVSASNLSRVIGTIERKLCDRWSRSVNLLEPRKKKLYLSIEGRKFQRLAQSFLTILSRQ